MRRAFLLMVDPNRVSPMVWQGLLGMPVKVVHSLTDALTMVRLYPHQVRVMVVHDQFGKDSMGPFCRQFKRLTNEKSGILVVSGVTPSLRLSHAIDAITQYPYEWPVFVQRVRGLWRAYHAEGE